MVRPTFENLESRQLLSVNPTPVGLTPQQVRHAYGFDQVTFSAHGQTIQGDGSGQTIAIVDAYDHPWINHDLKIFSRTFGLGTRDAAGKFVLTKAEPLGTVRSNHGWAQEIALDVEWAHAIAPKAHILLVEAPSPSIDDLLSAVDWARKQSGVVAVSMSWGGSEFPAEPYYNNYITTPKGHIGGSGIAGGISFFASAGDAGAGADWPAVSPNIVAVGGTTLNVDSSGNYKSESAWSGSGGGLAMYEPTAAPDVGYNADPNTGFAVYSAYADEYGDKGWSEVGGTSAGAPQWAALTAIVDQGRALQGKGSLDGPKQLLGALYSLNAADFHDITTGSNGYDAGPGYDLVTGRGTPVANRMINDLVALPANYTAANAKNLFSTQRIT